MSMSSIHINVNVNVYTINVNVNVYTININVNVYTITTSGHMFSLQIFPVVRFSCKLIYATKLKYDMHYILYVVRL